MPNDAFRVDAALCRRDGICTLVCPVRILRAEKGALPVLDEALRSRCIGCGQCMAFCPTAACVAPGLDAAESRPLRPELYPAPEQVDELLFARRTIRNFTKAAIPHATLETILDVVRYAPSGINRQPLRWVILDGRERTRAFLETVIDWLRHLPETDPAMADTIRANGVVRAWDKGTDILTRNAPHVVIPVGPDREYDSLDAIVALSYFEIVAQAHGVGCCWSGYFTRAFKHPAAGAVREQLGLGPEERAFSGIIAGFPRFKAVARPPRKPLRVTWL